MDYTQEQSENEVAFRRVLKTGKPELYGLFDLLERTKVNYNIIYKVIYALSNIGNGNGYGTVTITLENGKATFVRGEESNRVNEPIFIETQKIT